jgi:hypothetical protein
MIAKLFDSVFGCWHSRYSFPLTVHSRARSRAAAVTGTYVVCLDCGRELPYDWDEMKVVSPEQARRNRLNALATKHAA